MGLLTGLFDRARSGRKMPKTRAKVIACLLTVCCEGWSWNNSTHRLHPMSGAAVVGSRVMLMVQHARVT